MPEWMAIILLGIVEGVTEFLPISSTGHLLIFEQWLPRQDDLFNITIQSGAVLAVFLIFAKKIRSLVLNFNEPKMQSFALKLIVAFCVTAIGGLVIKKCGITLPESALPVVIVTVVGGVLILMVEKILKNKQISEEISWVVAISVGLAQILAAIFPGTSRSAATILAAMALGVARPQATEFSFLLGIPTLFAATALQLFSAISKNGFNSINWAHLILGTVISTITAFLVVKWLLRFIQTHSFIIFGWYRIFLGIVLLVVLKLF